ncbi:type A2 lanthipeptide [Priestia megaterium]|mgnify:CR=1 FL=1|uniref:type A2 lanthipeptide n=1 Tax=Priestia megaterium TaxID=1404 RepID=UPI001B3B57A0|nr:type A2 lanthipeptide [Priestia megaterium]
MKNFEMMAMAAIEDVQDSELEQLTGGQVPTITKDCPNTVSSVCVTFPFISACKNCD